MLENLENEPYCDIGRIREHRRNPQLDAIGKGFILSLNQNSHVHSTAIHNVNGVV